MLVDVFNFNITPLRTLTSFKIGCQNRSTCLILNCGTIPKVYVSAAESAEMLLKKIKALINCGNFPLDLCSANNLLLLNKVIGTIGKIMSYIYKI